MTVPPSPAFPLGEAEVSDRVRALVTALTLDEKAAMTAGSAIFALHGAARLGVPDLPVTDGPNGARGSSLFGSGEARAVCVPCGSALGATWDEELIEQVGEMLGEEARTKQARVLLAPTVNLHRSPLGGRTFECYSEDPLLSGKIAAAFVRGVQRRGVVTTVKHFAGNDAETERHTMNSMIDARALRELYLVPFELAVREGGSLGVMTAYNRLNGTYCAEHRELLTDILRGDWGFEGFVMTDWFSAATTDGSTAAGLDVEMPGPARVLGASVALAVREGRITEDQLDAMVTRQLTALARVGALDDAVGHEQSIDRPEHRALARRSAAESMVLLKNDGVLPFDLSSRDGADRKTLAVIGPNAARTQIMGGGSANLRPMYRTSILEALHDRLGEHVTIVHQPGCSIDRTAPSFGGPALRSPSGGQGFDVEVFPGDGTAGFDTVGLDTVGLDTVGLDTVGVDTGGLDTGEHGRRVPPAVVRRDTGRIMFMEAPAPGIELSSFGFRATAMFRPEVAGTHTFELVQMGVSRLYVDGVLVIDGQALAPPRGAAFFGVGSAPMVADVELGSDADHEIVVEYRTTPGAMFRGVDLGCRLPLPADALGAAVAAAAAADAVIVVVGTNDDWECEGEDRATMDLPGQQDEMVRRVLEANTNTAVVVNTGSPVTMPWADENSAGAVVQAWFGGQEMANALVDVLTGVTDPAGRLPTTLPLLLEHNPSYGNFPGDRSEVRYGESVLMGYRWYRSRRLPVRFPFGHGLSYTTFEIGAPVLSSSVFEPGRGSRLTVAVEVRNTGARRGAQVVQCYVAPPSSGMTRPEEELKAFAKVWLDPGESRTVTMTLGDRSFAYWDPAEPGWSVWRPRVATAMPTVPMTARNETPGWRIEPGMYELRIGTSCEAIVATATVTIDEGALLPPAS